MNQASIAMAKLLQGESVYEGPDFVKARPVLEMLTSMGELAETRSGTTRYWTMPHADYVRKQAYKGG